MTSSSSSLKKHQKKFSKELKKNSKTCYKLINFYYYFEENKDKNCFHFQLGEGPKKRNDFSSETKLLPFYGKFYQIFNFQ